METVFIPFSAGPFPFPSIVRCATFSQLISHSSNSISREIYHRPPAHGLKEVGEPLPDRGLRRSLLSCLTWVGFVKLYIMNFATSSLSFRLLIRLWIVYSWLRNLLFIHSQKLGRPQLPVLHPPKATSQRCKPGWPDGEMGRRENLFITLVSEYFIAIVPFLPTVYIYMCNESRYCAFVSHKISIS